MFADVSNMRISKPFKLHGGKHYLSNFIVDHLPANYSELVYIEPFCGAISVLLKKEKSHKEVINDMDYGVYVILNIIRDRPYEFMSRLQSISYNIDTFNEALNAHDFKRDIDYAVNEFILRRMSRGGLKEAFAWSDRKRGGIPGDINAWNNVIKAIPNISNRIKDVEIYNKPAVDIIQEFNHPNTILYCDPPYLHETRQAKNVYKHEMTNEDHEELARCLNTFSGKAMLSGYQSGSYSQWYSNWKTDSYRIINHSSQQKTKTYKEEWLWLNY